MTRPHRRVPLNESFRFIHEPLGTTASEDAHRFIGRESELKELAARILLSNGGAFLVTGYRGVGKTTFVNRVVQTVQQEAPRAEPLVGAVEIVDVYINFARPMRAVELMYHVLRALYLRLAEKHLLKRLEPDLAHDLELAYSRTTATVAYSASDSRERGMDIGDLGVRLPLLPALAPSFSFKRTRGSSRELSYLTYDDKAAEHDLIRIARRLTTTALRQAPRGPFARFRRPRAGGPRLKVIFVFDELDKIDEGRNSDTRSALDRVLNNLKNLFTTSGITFLFVAGKDLHDRWLEDIGRGDSIYESVFTYARYLPVMWASSDQMCDPLVDVLKADGDGHHAAYTAFKKFLAFKGRGIPRRMIRGFNEFVRWDGETPCLTFAPEDERQFQFYAGLHDLLVENESTLLGRLHGTTGSDRIDQRRLSLYYLTDWILQQGSSDFTLHDVVAASKRLNRMIAPSDDAATEIGHALIRVLTENGYLEEVRRADATQAVQLGPNVEAAPTRYVIPRRRLVEMGSLSGLFEQEAEVLFAKQPEGIPAGRYQVQRLIGRGGMSSVYEATDVRTGRRVALKQLATALGSPELRARFERESRILAGLRHPNIVQLHDVDFSADPPYLVMEYVEGAVLTDMIRQGRFSDERVGLKLMHDLVGAVSYLHDQGVLWRDPKPANIMITPEGRLVLLDFGIARTQSETETRLTQAALGTPAYMSPEQIQGLSYDMRSDIYGLGVIFFEMVTGSLPFRADDAMALMMKHVKEPAPRPSERAAVSPELEAVILRCLEKEPEGRYASAADLLAALPAPGATVRLDAPVRQAIEQLQDSAAREEQGTDYYGGTIVAPRGWVPTVADSISFTAPFLIPQAEAGASVVLIPLAAREVGMGRSFDNPVVVTDNGASRYHARLAKVPEGYAVEDLNSFNGTYVNDVRIDSRVVLHHNDRIRIGAQQWTYQNPWEAGPAPVPAPPR